MKKTVFISIAIFLLFTLRLQFLPKLDLKDGQLVRVTGVLREEPKISGNRQSFKLGHFEIWTERWPEYHYGDEVEITGKLKVQSAKCKVAVQSSKFKKLFCNEKYLLSYPEIESDSITEFCKERPCSTARPLLIKGTAIWLRGRMLEVYKKVFPPAFDGIMAGVVLGDKSLISRDFWEKLKATGTLHILVASGMNIAMFAPGLLEALCAIFVRKISLLILISLIWFYTLMAGFQAPIVRAAIMASLLYLGQFFGRQTEGKRILWTTGILMVFLSPELIFDVGFQLSFLATAGLVYIQPKIKNLIFKSDNFTSSVSAQLATLPVLLLNFGQFNLLSPLANLAILWTIPYILQAGMGLGILGIIEGIGGVWGVRAVGVLAYLLYPLLFYLEKVINWSASLTIFQMELRIGWWWVVIYYLILWRWVRKD